MLKGDRVYMAFGDSEIERILSATLGENDITLAVDELDPVDGLCTLDP